MRPSLAIPVLAALAAMACATNPVTGQRELNLMSEAQEVQMGQQSDPAVRAEMGVYPDPALQQYVEGVGMRLAGASQRPDLPWHFTVVDVPAVNAFALPGGYIYITRGLLAHLDTEAEMAGVLGHEIGHVTARHSAHAYTRSVLVGGTLAATSIFVPQAQPYAEAAQVAFGMLFLKYSRDQEIQSDRLGADYASKIGYAPSGMVGVLETLGRIGAASDRRGVPNWLSTHPQPADRVAKVEANVRALEATRPAPEWVVNRDAYWQRLAGLTYGDNPREGVVRGREFLHPDLRFKVRFPDGWAIENGKRQVTSAPPGANDMTMVLELVPDASASSLEATAVRSMTKAGFTLVTGEATRINGLAAYRGVYDGRLESGGLVRVEAAHISHGRQVFLLAGLASQARFRQAQPYFADTIRSFAPADAAEVSGIKPSRLAFATVRSGETWQGIAQRTGGLISASDLAVLNGWAVENTPPVGQRIKIVVAGE